MNLGMSAAGLGFMFDPAFSAGDLIHSTIKRRPKMTTPVVDPNTGKVSWTDPTTNTDGSPVASGELTGFTVGIRDTTAAGSAAGTYPFSASAPASATTELVSLLSPLLPKGVDLVAAVKAVAGTTESDWSPESVAFQLPVPAPVPNPPTQVSVQ